MINLGPSTQHPKEWIDGFLFVGNHRALDLLNTRLVNAGGPVELLADTTSLERWVNAVGTAEGIKGKLAARPWHHSQTTRRFLKELLIFREDLLSSASNLDRLPAAISSKA
jgi:hypothetical protein